MSIQNLREQRGALFKEINEVANKAAFDPVSDQAFLDGKYEQVDRIDAQIAAINKANEKIAADALGDQVRDATYRAVHNGGGDYRELYQKWLKGGDNAMNAADWGIRNTMSTTTGSEGGFTVPTEVATTLLRAMKSFGGMREVAEVIQTSEGNPINFPTSDGTGVLGELIGENAPATDQDMAFGVRTLNTYKYSSKIVPVPFELLQDSSVDLESYIRLELAERLARITNRHFTTGTGTGQPNGIVTAATSGKVGATGQTLTVTYDDLVDLQHSVDPAYRDRGRARFMMNDLSIRQIRKIKDTTGRPIFVPGYEVAGAGVPDTLLGTPVVINQDVAAMAANARSILFGDFSYYKIRDVMSMSLFRFTDSPYTKLGQVAFLAWMRSGGQFVDNGGAVKFYQNSAT
jgi:HK97 family phage major capsid protein